MNTLHPPPRPHEWNKEDRTSSCQQDQRMEVQPLAIGQSCMYEDFTLQITILEGGSCCGLGWGRDLLV